MSEVGEDGSVLVGFSRLEGGVMGQIVDEDVQGVTEDSSRNEGTDDDGPPGPVFNDGHDESLTKNKSDGEVQREGILLHEFLDFGVLFEDHSSSGGVGFVVVHKVEVTLVTLEEGARISIGEGKLIGDIGKHTLLS